MSSPLLRLDEVRERVAKLSKSSIYARVKAGTFPAPIKIGPRASAWRSTEIEAWIDNPTGWRADAAKAA